MADSITTADVRRILGEKYPPRVDHEKVYASITLALAERGEEVERNLTAALIRLSNVTGYLCKTTGLTKQQVTAIATGGAGCCEYGGGHRTPRSVLAKLAYLAQLARLARLA
jgi:hypothetical protein